LRPPNFAGTPLQTLFIAQTTWRSTFPLRGSILGYQERRINNVAALYRSRQDSRIDEDVTRLV
jgi:hypothetical protein